MSDTENENLRLRLREAERQIQGLNRQHSFLYQFVESLQKEFEKTRGDPFSESATRDPFPCTDTIRAERDELAAWKLGQLSVTARWNEIDNYVRSHPSTLPGDSVVAAALRLLKERDVLVRGLQTINAAMLRPVELGCPQSNYSPCPIS